MIADYEARQQAIDPTRSFIVQAPAGSGKTGLLTQRFLQLLARVDKPEEIVAITFTRKAAAEMRQRLLEALHLGHQSEPPTDDYQRQTWELAARVLRRDTRQQWKLEHNPSRLRIQTIDSLCSSLVRQLPVMSGLGSAVDPTENPEELYQQAARRTLSWLDSDHGMGGTSLGDYLARVIQHLDNDLVKVEKLIVTMLARRDQWMPYTSDEEGFRQHLEACLERLIGEEIALPTSFRSEFGTSGWRSRATRCTTSKANSRRRCVPDRSLRICRFGARWRAWS
jgi:ATP-dependent helicase/nuclease subunit A